MGWPGRKRKIGHRGITGRLLERNVPKVKRYADLFFDEPTAVYVFKAGPTVKIGISVEVAKRLSGLQTGNTEEIQIVWYRWFEGVNARQIERSIHRRLRGESIHARGEWYFIEPETAVALVERTAQLNGFKMIADSIDLGPEPVGYLESREII